MTGKWPWHMQCILSYPNTIPLVLITKYTSMFPLYAWPLSYTLYRTFPALSSHFACSSLDSKASNTKDRDVVIFKQKGYFLVLFSSTVAPRRPSTRVGFPRGCEVAKMNIRDPQRTQNLLFHTAMTPCCSFTLRGQANCTLSSGLLPLSWPKGMWNKMYCRMQRHS